MVITQGGTYTGNYQSLTSGVPCILVNTTAPVVLQGCNLSGAGNLIQSGSGGNLVVRNCTGTGLAPTVNNQAPGHFVDAYQSQSLVIEHNLFSGTSGIVVNRWSGAGAGPTLTVRYNQARNIDGRWRNGGDSRSSFLILNTVQHLPGVEIAYNEVLNTPDQSLVEDNINFYNSSGTAGSPVHVHDNFVRGAYPFPATSAKFTGTGITTDGDAQTADEATAFVEADHNQFVSIGNSAMNIASGHDIYYHDNRAVTSGYLPSGQRFNAGFCGLGVFNYYQQPGGVFYNNRVAANTVGVVRWGGNSPFPDRQDEAPDACAPCQGTIHLPAPIAAVTEAAEWTLWQSKLLQNGVVPGLLGAVLAPAKPAPAAPAAPVAGQVANPGFEADGAAVGSPTGWQTWTGGLTSASVDYTEAYGGAHSGTYHGTHYSILPYEVYTYQVVNSLPNGTYAFKAWVRSGGGQTQAQLQAKGYGGPVATADVPATPNGQWVQVTLPNLVVTSGQCEIGFYSKAGAGQFVYFDDVELVAQQQSQNAPPTVALTATSNIVLGQAIALTATAADANGTVAKVEFFNGSAKLGEATAAPYQLSWTPPAAGSYALTARATDDTGAATTSAAVTVSVAAAVPTPVLVAAGANLVLNPGFEADGAAVGSPTGWQTWTGQDTDAGADYTETYGGAHAGTYHATHYRTSAYEIYTYQMVQNVPAGSYAVRAWVKGGGGHQTQLRIKSYGGPDIVVDAPATPNGQWVQVAVPNLVVTSGQCEIGFYSKAGAGQWLYFDDVELVAQSGLSTGQVSSAALLNPGFEADGAAVDSPTGWQTVTGLNTDAGADYTETYGRAHSGTYHATHYRTSAYEIYTYQVVKNLPAGTYAVRAWVQGSGQSQLQVQNYGGLAATLALPAAADWVQVTLPNVTVSAGQCEIGFYTKAAANQWLYFDDVELVLQSGPSAGQTASAAALAPAPTLYPNPADDQVAVAVNFPQPTAVVLVVTDMQGTPVARSEQQARAGDNQFILRTADLPSGVYVLQIQSSLPTSVQRLEVKH
ncbi:Ig-like domain-containing protein [Hymenobacter caeli]|uniref:Secretion system C-terminal sorting domain-containing protein n=1 Tax=Hymenobacter caeli TaxID=2735894 RepID=A0ABX2FNI2_9BACT|nr:Ig-like domain-containing protein [Hymenobacter caeli]NRT18733.1 hypothetical protein [Hymenobacter caeli]